ncbi:unnamed protein product, partial [Laminaria digitata]
SYNEFRVFFQDTSGYPRYVFVLATAVVEAVETLFALRSTRATQQQQQEQQWQQQQVLDGRRPIEARAINNTCQTLLWSSPSLLTSTHLSPQQRNNCTAFCTAAKHYL